MTICCTVF